jgi:putative spermidine/putrescine transport system permease protein
MHPAAGPVRRVRGWTAGAAAPLLLAAPLVVFLAAGFVWPLLRVLAISFTDPQPGVGNYVALAQSAGIRQMLLNTLSISAATTAGAVVLGYVLAAGIVGMRAKTRGLILLLLVFSLWLSVLIRSFGWLVVLGDRGVINNLLASLGLISRPIQIIDSYLAVVIGMVHYMTPIATLPILSALEQMDPRMGQAARSLGAGPVMRFLRVELPLAAPGVLSAALLSFLFALGFYIIPALLGGGRQTMIAEFISLNVLDLPRWGVATSCAAVLLAATLLLLAALSRLGNIEKMLGGR